MNIVQLVVQRTVRQAPRNHPVWSTRRGWTTAAQVRKDKA